MIVDGTYEEAVAQAASDGAGARAASSSPTSALSGPAEWVIDGYATLFAELPARLVASRWCRSAWARWARPRRAGAPPWACR